MSCDLPQEQQVNAGTHSELDQLALFKALQQADQLCKAMSTSGAAVLSISFRVVHDFDSLQMWYRLFYTLLCHLQTTDKKVNEVTPPLFELAPDAKAMADMEVLTSRQVLENALLVNPSV